MEAKLSPFQYVRFALKEPFRSDRLTFRQRRLANRIFTSNSIRFGQFYWKIHSQEGITVPAPIYTELRDLLRGDDTARRLATKEYRKLLHRIPKKRRPNAVADVPIGSTPGAALLADRLRMPLLTARIDKKDHGSGAKVNGFLQRNPHAFRPVIVEDVVSFGISSLAIVDALRQQGVTVTDVIAILDNGVGAKEFFNSHGMHFQSVFSTDQLLRYGVRRGFISADQSGQLQQEFNAFRQGVKKEKQV